MVKRFPKVKLFKKTLVFLLSVKRGNKLIGDYYFPQTFPRKKCRRPPISVDFFGSREIFGRLLFEFRTYVFASPILPKE